MLNCITFWRTMSEKEENIIDLYLKLTNKYKAEYGERTVVLLQLGSFYEIYGITKDASSSLVEISPITPIEEMSQICSLNIAEKKISYNGKKVLLSGFRDYSLDKYIPKITEAGYTAVVYKQEKSGKEFVRKLDVIYSPGTFVSCDTDSSPQITNNIMCVWIDIIKTKMICGISVVNIFTGKSYIYEYQTTFLLNNTTFDELERFVSVFQPSEVLFLSPFENNSLKKAIQYSGISCPSVHYYNTNNTSDNKIYNCENQQYIKQILSVFYNEEAYDICSEFHENIIATQSYCFLLNFIQEHNPDLVRKISIPTFNNTSDRMILANHTLMQLNIIDDGSQQNMGQYSSVLSFLNKCCSAIGKRDFKYQLTNPTSNVEWLNKEYEMIGTILYSQVLYKSSNQDIVDNIRKLLLQTRDIEKIIRQIITKKIYPSSIAQLYKTIEIVVIIYEMLENFSDLDHSKIFDYLSDNKQCSYIKDECNNLMKYLNETLNIDACKKISSMTTFEENIIKRNVSEKLDKIVLENEKNIRIFNKIREHLNGLMQKNDNSFDTDYIRIHETEKSGSSLQITSKRSQTLKTILENIPDKDKSIKIEDIFINMSEFKFVKVTSTSSNMDIEHPVLNQVCKKMLVSREEINELISITYLEILNHMEKNWIQHMESISRFIGKLDVLLCKVYLAKKYNYCSPEIDEKPEHSFVSASDLRHCLIEHIQQNEIYVSNDISLGKNNENGMLLYGTNAVGKTSLIRALGIAIIMAQAGMFVPCTEFVFKPYTAIYSRILGNDNIFKGLSTFAVEMSELRIILKMSDKNSLILGDELCSGTETESALSIFVAGLMKLCENKSSFIFATHFHEIVNYSEIKDQSGIQMKHMEVAYDRENDCLIYDRKLKDGSGPRTYGLEVCKSLYLDQEFMDLAYSIRNKYYPESRGELSNSPSRYNRKKIRGVCEICNVKMGEEVHHMSPQREADDTGYIGGFHKNHKANLLNVCEKCHDNIHSSPSTPSPSPPTSLEKKLVKKKTTRGYRVLSDILG